MEKKELYRQIDHKRWLMNNALFDDSVKNDLFFYGSISHPNVKALDFNINPDTKTINYVVYLDEKDYNLTEKFIKLSKSDSFFGLWRYKRMLEKHGNLDPAKHVNLAIKDFAGPSWSAGAQIKRLSEYDPEPYSKDDGEDFGPGADAHRDINGG